MKNISKNLILCVILLSFLYLPGSVFAATCDVNEMSKTAPWWGDNSQQNVSASVGNAVKISGQSSGVILPDEQACIGKNADFQIFKGSALSGTASGTLQSGGILAGKQKYFINWTVPSNFQSGDYKVKLLRIDGRSASTNLSGNLLQLGQRQACVFDGVGTVSPASVNQFGSGDATVTWTVRVKPAGAGDSCNNWGVTAGVVLLAGPGGETAVANLGERRVATGASSVTFTWDARGKNPGAYAFKATMGSQNITSQRFELTDQAASSDKFKCVNGACVRDPGGIDILACRSQCSSTPDSPSTQNFEILNPIGIDTFQELVNVIGRWIFNLAIPIAVIIIIYAGILMLTSGGDPGRFKKGREALTYAVIGLAIVLIGKGFVTLIQSILSLRNP